jgi:cholesterol transport system auxiliary component
VSARRVRTAVAAGGAVLASALAGCGSLFGGDAPAPTFHVWRSPRPVATQCAPASSTSPRALLLAPTGTATFYDTQRIVFSPEPGIRGYYQFAAWTERPGKRFDELLLECLERRRSFAQVASLAAGTRGDLLLAVSIAELYHDNAQPPGRARLVVSAELVDRGTRTLLGRRSFEQDVPLADADASSAVAGFGIALGRLLEELLQWVEATAAAKGGRG